MRVSVHQGKDPDRTRFDPAVFSSAYGVGRRAGRHGNDGLRTHSGQADHIRHRAVQDEGGPRQHAALQPRGSAFHDDALAAQLILPLREPRSLHRIRNQRDAFASLAQRRDPQNVRVEVNSVRNHLHQDAVVRKPGPGDPRFPMMQRRLRVEQMRYLRETCVRSRVDILRRRPGVRRTGHNSARRQCPDEFRRPRELRRKRHHPHTADSPGQLPVSLR